MSQYPREPRARRARRWLAVAVLGTMSLLLAACSPAAGSIREPATLVASPSPRTPAPTPASPSPTPTPVRPPGWCTGGSLQVVAHPDDDLLFMTPDLLHDFTATPDRCIRTVFVTAGDAGKGADYWRTRETGIEAAYAQAAGVANGWESSSFSAAGRPVLVRTLAARPSVQVVFLRLPEGLLYGEGSQTYGFQTLTRLADGSIPAITAVDASATYTAGGLQAALEALLEASEPVHVRTLDCIAPLGDDNMDHQAVACLTRDAGQRVDLTFTLTSYDGYPAKLKPENVSGDDLARTIAVYDAYQVQAMPTERKWKTYHMARRYVLDQHVVHGPQPRTGPGHTPAP